MEKSSFGTPYFYLYRPSNQPEPLVDLLLTLAIPIVLALVATIITLITLRVFKKNKKNWINVWLGK